jgi:hypothetical protein
LSFADDAEERAEQSALKVFTIAHNLDLHVSRPVKLARLRIGVT